MKTVFLIGIKGILAGIMVSQDDYDYVDHNSFPIEKNALNGK